MFCGCSADADGFKGAKDTDEWSGLTPMIFMHQMERHQSHVSADIQPFPIWVEEGWKCGSFSTDVRVCHAETRQFKICPMFVSMRERKRCLSRVFI